MTGWLVHAPNSSTGVFDLAAVAEDDGLHVLRLDLDRPDLDDTLVRAVRPGVIYRCAGGLLARAVAAGADVELAGAHAEWFVELPVEVTGRTWSLTDVAGARRALTTGSAFVKLADAKYRALPARRYRSPDELEKALSTVHGPSSLRLLVTHQWLPIHSEYRTFSVARDVVSYSPYLVEDELWSPLLRTHRASFDDDAAAFASDVLASLQADDVPPTAVVDVARLQDGAFVVLEVNHVWSSGLYGCDPRAVLHAVRAAVDPAALKQPQWRWHPDLATTALRG